MQNEFASRVKAAGVPALMATREESIAMHLVLSGMFDAEIKRVKDLNKELSKHEDAIRTVAEIKAMKAEAEEFSARAVAALQEATDTLERAKSEAAAIVEDAKKGAQAAVKARAATLAETQQKADAIIEDANKQAAEMVAGGKSMADDLLAQMDQAQTDLAGYRTEIEAANKQLSDINKTVAGEKARLIKLFDK